MSIGNSTEGTNVPGLVSLQDRIAEAEQNLKVQNNRILPVVNNCLLQTVQCNVLYIFILFFILIYFNLYVHDSTWVVHR